jgi:hypothetical protein
MSLTLDDLAEELARGNVYECSLRDPKFRLDGLQDGEKVYIDPRPAIIETLLHELIHRMRRTWGERRVTKEARRLLSTMADADLALFWSRYQRIKKRSRPVEIDLE